MRVSKKVGCAISSVVVFAVPVEAREIYDGEQLDLSAYVTMVGAAQQGNNVNYGAGNFLTGKTNNTNLEGAVEVGAGMTWDLGQSKSIYANLSGVGAIQRWDGELSGQFGDGSESNTSKELANIGFSNKLLDISFGAQDFMVGDGFLLGDGNFDTARNDGTYWAAPHTAWDKSTILRLNTNPIRADLFWIEADEDSFEQAYAGVNAEYALPEEGGSLAVMYFNVVDDDGSGDNSITGSDTILSGNKGAEYLSFRANNIAVPSIDNLTFHGEYARLGGEHDESDLKYDADAWYLELNYNFAEVTWTPVLSYRYSSFSGDDLSTSKNEGFAIPNYGIGRDWDTWFQGEITGEYHLFNNNQNTHLIKLKAYPDEQWAVALYYLNFTLAENHWYGTPTTSDDWADEVNITLEYYPTDDLYVFGALAWSTPGDAAKEMLGDDDAVIAEVWFTYTF